MIFVLALIAGVLIGVFTPLSISAEYSAYFALATLACLDSIFGGFVATVNRKFDVKIFLTGFFGNAIIASFLVWFGNLLGIDMTIAGVVVFGTRLFNNFAALRRYWFSRGEDFYKKYKEKHHVKK
jgi:small basic protein